MTIQACRMSKIVSRRTPGTEPPTPMLLAACCLPRIFRFRRVLSQNLEGHPRLHGNMLLRTLLRLGMVLSQAAIQPHNPGPCATAANQANYHLRKLGITEGFRWQARMAKNRAAEAAAGGYPFCRFRCHPT